MDIIVHVGRVPVGGETVMSRHPDSGLNVPGGKGANQVRELRWNQLHEVPS